MVSPGKEQQEQTTKKKKIISTKLQATMYNHSGQRLGLVLFCMDTKKGD